MIDWAHWHNEPFLVGGLVFLGWLWAIFAGPLRRRLAPDESFPCAAAVKFYSALVLFYLAVGSPLDQIGERFLFSAHMFQHQLLMYPVPVLFLLGLPGWMLDPVLSRRSLRWPLRLLTHPVICIILPTLVISIWHRPELYDWALQDKLVHVLEHVMFFAFSLLSWWPILSPSRVYPRLGYGGQMLYLVGGLLAMTPVYAYVTFADEILYPTYEFAPRLSSSFSAMDDQLLAGVSMKILGMAVSGIAFGIAFYRWFQASEKSGKEINSEAMKPGT